MQLKVVGFVSRCACGLAAVLAVLLGGSTASAQTLTWNNGAGNMLWNNSSADWTGSVWSDGNDAVFNGTGVGTINVSGNVGPNSLTFNVNGYTLAGGSITFTTGAGVNANGAVYVAGGDNATIASTIAGAGG